MTIARRRIPSDIIVKSVDSLVTKLHDIRNYFLTDCRNLFDIFKHNSQAN